SWPAPGSLLGGAPALALWLVVGVRGLGHVGVHEHLRGVVVHLDGVALGSPFAVQLHALAGEDRHAADGITPSTTENDSGCATCTSARIHASKPTWSWSMKRSLSCRRRTPIDGRRP